MQLVRAHAWWVVLSLAGAVVLGQVVDRPWLVAVYGVTNVLGTLLVLEGTHVGQPRRALAQVATVVQLPMGLVGLLLIFGSSSPRDYAPQDSVAQMRDLPRNRDDSSFRFGGPRNGRP